MAAFRFPTPAIAASATDARYLLWIDGVGAYLVCLAQRVTIGGHRPDGQNADLPLMSNLNRQHATLIRGTEGYVLESHGPVKVSGRPVQEKLFLTGDRELELGSSVKVRFRLPSVLSMTATLDFVSDRRPSHTIDGVILMEDNLLIGPSRDNHIRCPNWSEAVLLYRRGEQLWCKARGDVFVDQSLARSGSPLRPGQIVQGKDLRFRLESAPW